MSAQRSTKTLLGGALLVIGTAVILYVSQAGELILPGLVGSLAALCMAAGALLVGTDGVDGTPV